MSLRLSAGSSICMTAFLHVIRLPACISLCMCVCISVYVCSYVRLQLRLFPSLSMSFFQQAYLYMTVCVSVFLPVTIHTYLSDSEPIHVFISLYVCMSYCVWMYACFACIYIYIYIYIYNIIYIYINVCLGNVCVYMSACLLVGNRVSSVCLYPACMTHSPSVSLSVSLSLSLTDYVCLTVHVSQSVCMYVSLCLFAYLSVCLTDCLSVYLAVCQSYLLSCLPTSGCLSINLVRLFVYMSVYMQVYVCLYRIIAIQDSI